MNTRLLRKVQTYMLAEPRRVDMRQALSRADSTDPSRSAPACNTVGCIAGTAVLLSTTKHPRKGEQLVDFIARVFHVGWWDEGKLEWLPECGEGILPLARVKLKLDAEQAERLFHRVSWPLAWRTKLDAANTGSTRYAKVVCARIDHFIKTKGLE